MKALTYHHIVKREYGGRTTIENGALLSAENHQWFNKQTPEEQERLNNIFQEYKLGVIELNGKGIQQAQEIKLDFRFKEYDVIPVEKLYEAIEYLKSFKNILFDGKIVDALLDFTAVYPSGSVVVTNEGNVAVVIKQNKGM